ncbi:permease [Permianibacter aggregans]|uniref:Permease n=1 Tax=Permianibacter aggregans TaxID=1510150 RepID=A0A4R6UIH3_9GAMM|nr:permease [Permianibacter aggregans]QGX39941.1 permease [Permianibacter aggregans]TDQ46252.1 hypothetical protein EV696_11437 [Permianibacter aggregans]
MSNFWQLWHQSALTSVGLFWMAFWAFGLGYAISAMIQVFVTREKMRQTMGESGAKSVALGTLFGFISSSCSFAALSATRALFAKGAGLIPALAFLLASTNLVIELGIVISLFLSWQFVVGEYVGGLLLILLMWLLVHLTGSDKLIQSAREKAREAQSGPDHGDQEKPSPLTEKASWRKVAMKYLMEWQMVWKDVTIGFTVAGIIAVFAPDRFFHALFPGAGNSSVGFLDILLQALIGPLAAFFTFIGSMGNIPLAAVLFSHGVSFAGVMAFIFSDLVVLPVLRIQAQYYGWKFALYVLAIFLLVLVVSALLLHYAFDLLGWLPSSSLIGELSERQYFAIDYTLAINLLLIGVTLHCLYLHWQHADSHSHDHGDSSLSERILWWLSMLAYCWLGIGLLLGLLR